MIGVVGRRELDGIDGVGLAPADDAEHRRSWFVYVVALAPEIDRARVMADLRERGVDTAEYVPCIHLQSYMRESFGFTEGLCPVAEGISSKTLALPFFPEIDPGDQEYVVDAVKVALG